MTWALKLKQTVEEGLVLYRNIFRGMEKQKSQKLQCIYVRLHQVCLPLLPPLGTPLPLPPRPLLRQQDQPLIFLLLLSLLNMKITRMKTFMMTHFHLMNSK